MKIWRSAGAALKPEDERKLAMVKPLVNLGMGLVAGAAFLALVKSLVASSRRPPK